MTKKSHSLLIGAIVTDEDENCLESANSCGTLVVVQLIRERRKIEEDSLFDKNTQSLLNKTPATPDYDSYEEMMEYQKDD